MEHALLARIDELAENLLRLPSWPSPARPRIQEHLEALQRLLRRIQAALSDAEKRGVHEELVKLWLGELRGVAYDADDALDESVLSERQRLARDAKRLARDAKRLAQEVLITVQTAGPTHLPHERRHQEVGVPATASTPLDVLSCTRMAEMFGGIRGRFEEISKQLGALHLREEYGERQLDLRTAECLPSSHLVDTTNIYGRKYDLEKVIHRLLWSDAFRENNLSVLSIVGMGGVGKTTLVQHLYNDQDVSAHFPLKGWVCVPHDATLQKLTASIIESLTKKECCLNELSVLQEKLVEVVDKKRFLLVLDDVWNENPRLWESLQKPLRFGGKGSAVITTTRNESVAKMMQTVPPHRLDCLSVDDCWAVFKESAFVDRYPSGLPDLMKIGRKIAKKCGGLPLAAKSLGGLLRYENNVDTWADVLKSNIWDLGDQGGGIIPALRLSYLHLPNHLKPCFLYASIFPKDFKFSKDVLVLLWMAQGFLRCKGSRQAEDIGNMVFEQLLQRSFFQCCPRHMNEEDPKFVMHDLIHDLARSILGRELFHIEQGKLHIPPASEARHLLVSDESINDMWMMMQSLTCPTPWAVRTLLLSGAAGEVLKLPEEMLPNLKSLRTLDLRCAFLFELPASIKDLRHLRYLNLESSHVVRLPDSICQIYSLETLCLRNCVNLESLPRNVGNLSNLRCLQIEGTEVLSEHICRLTNLRALDEFTVGGGALDEFTVGGGHVPDGLVMDETRISKRQKFFQIDGFVRPTGFVYLRGLNNLVHLRGRLKISNLQYVMDAKDAELADLRNKRSIRELNLHWKKFKKFSLQPAASDVQTQVMENLRPPDSLEVLRTHFYGGLFFPSWMADDQSPLSKLTRLEITFCRWCRSLPPLGRLPLLKHLEITGMDMVEAVNLEFRGHGSTVGFPALEELVFSEMRAWVTWESVERGDFPRLRRLSVSICQSLESMVPLYLFPALQVLDIKFCPKLKSIELHTSPSASSSSSSTSLSSSMGPPPLREMIIKHCPLARFYPEDDEQQVLPPTLQDLTIDWGCPLLEEWCEGGGRSWLAHIPNAKVWKTRRASDGGIWVTTSTSTAKEGGDSRMVSEKEG